MVYENGGEFEQPNAAGAFACEESMRRLYERARTRGGMNEVVKDFVNAYLPHTFESYDTVVRLANDIAVYMRESTDDATELMMVAMKGATTALCVTHETYDGILDIESVMSSIPKLCSADETGLQNINSFVDKAGVILQAMPKDLEAMLQEWRASYSVDYEYGTVFNTGFVIVMAAAQKEVGAIQLVDATWRREIEGVNWDLLLAGDE